MFWNPKPEDDFKWDLRQTMYPTVVDVRRNSTSEEQVHPVGEIGQTTYGVVLGGLAHIEHRLDATVSPGAYFCVPGPFVMKLTGDSAVAFITRAGFNGQLNLGYVEEKGRLTYIDGCSDSVLVYPPRLGDPVLNHLHFGGDILQTQHTHPSIRVGVVVGGEGVSWRGRHGEKDDLKPFMLDAIKMGGLDKVFKSYDDQIQVDGVAKMYPGVEMAYHLKAGGVFVLEEQELHSFATMPGGHMDIVAYHPDSDFGPTDENHPMLNRTLIKHGQ